MHIAILDDYQDCVRTLACFKQLQGHQVTILTDTYRDEDALAARLADVEALVLIRERTRITASLLAKLLRLKIISQTAKAGAHIDMAACTARGVAVAEGSGDPVSTAELTLALMLAARRNIVTEANRLKDGLWQGTLGRALNGQRLGIWGYGKIGARVAGYARAMGMQVWAWGREGSAARAKADGLAVAPSKEAFLGESDIVSLHVRLSPETRGLVTAADLALMRSDALLVNTSRAELVVPGALESALRLNHPGQAAVDVFEAEPVLGADHPLLTLPNALCTPHLGYVERNNYELYFGQAFANVVAFAQGKPTGIANPQVLA
jgi:D-3-phosphoglycerate dehydrogenase / 2-oxoglutarate reductase